MWVDESRLAEYLSAGHRLAESEEPRNDAKPPKTPESNASSGAERKPRKKAKSP